MFIFIDVKIFGKYSYLINRFFFQNLCKMHINDLFSDTAQLSYVFLSFYCISRILLKVIVHVMTFLHENGKYDQINQSIYTALLLLDR